MNKRIKKTVETRSSVTNSETSQGANAPYPFLNLTGKRNGYSESKDIEWKKYGISFDNDGIDDLACSA